MGKNAMARYPFNHFPPVQSSKPRWVAFYFVDDSLVTAKSQKNPFEAKKTISFVQDSVPWQTSRNMNIKQLKALSVKTHKLFNAVGKQITSRNAKAWFRTSWTSWSSRSPRSSQKCFEAIRTIGTIEAIFGFHLITSIVSKSDTARFGPGEATLFWRESCKSKRKIPKVIYWLRFWFL